MEIKDTPKKCRLIPSHGLSDPYCTGGYCLSSLSGPHSKSPAENLHLFQRSHRITLLSDSESEKWWKAPNPINRPSSRCRMASRSCASPQRSNGPWSRSSDRNREESRPWRIPPAMCRPGTWLPPARGIDWFRWPQESTFPFILSSW